MWIWLPSRLPTRLSVGLARARASGERRRGRPPRPSCPGSRSRLWLDRLALRTRSRLGSPLHARSRLSLSDRSGGETIPYVRGSGLPVPLRDRARGRAALRAGTRGEPECGSVCAKAKRDGDRRPRRRRTTVCTPSRRRAATARRGSPTRPRSARPRASTCASRCSRWATTWRSPATRCPTPRFWASTFIYPAARGERRCCACRSLTTRPTRRRAT